MRKALGATRSATSCSSSWSRPLVLCLARRVLGILLGVWVTGHCSPRATGWNTLISPQSIIMAFGFSAAIGLIFGIWPARRAAKLDPDCCIALR